MARVVCWLLLALVAPGCDHRRRQDLPKPRITSVAPPETSARAERERSTEEAEIETRIVASRGPVYIFLEMRFHEGFPDNDYTCRAFLQTPGEPRVFLLDCGCQVQQCRSRVSGSRLPNGRLALLSFEDLVFELDDGRFATTQVGADPPDERAREALVWVAGRSLHAEETRLAALALARLDDRRAMPALTALLDEHGREGARGVALLAARARLDRGQRDLADLRACLQAPEALESEQILDIVAACPPQLADDLPRVRATLAQRGSAPLARLDRERARCAARGR
jgi:hypothetical protein